MKRFSDVRLDLGRRFVWPLAFTATLALGASFAYSESDAVEHVRDEYGGKTLVLRGFPTGDLLRYDRSGSAVGGDWTTDGFVRIDEIRMSNKDQLIIKAQRMAVAWVDKKEFELRPWGKTKKKGNGARLDIMVDPGMHNPSAEQLDALLAKIFLTAQDSLADAVPDYWKPCVSGGLRGADKNCAFAPELLAIPGVAAKTSDYFAGGEASGEPTDEQAHPADGSFRVGKSGVSPPRAIFMPEPRFSDCARAAGFQGVVTLGLRVSKEGLPTDIHIVSPLGYGLDAQAVAAVSQWKFKPAQKQGDPVQVEIAVEVDFHLF